MLGVADETDGDKRHPDPPHRHGRGGPITIEGVDIDWNPNGATLPADTNVTILVANNGVAYHTFVIEELGIKLEIEPGQTQEVVVNARAGTYEFTCNVPGHAQAGTLIVE